MLAAVVLAAGQSSRMGFPKALLTAPDGRPFVGRIAAVLTAAGVSTVTVVTGADHTRIVDTAASTFSDVQPVWAQNPDPSRGQLSSLWTGMETSIGPDTEAMLITLVDVPMIDVETVTRIIECWRRTGAPIVRPAIGDRHGHPVLFDRALFSALRAAPLDAGVKSVVRAYADRIVNVTTSNEGCLSDIDTRAEYERLLGVDPELSRRDTKG